MLSIGYIVSNKSFKIMDFEARKKILLAYIDADIEGRIPSRSAFIPGVGQSPDLKAHADDTFRIIAKHFANPDMQQLVDGMITQMNCILLHLD